MGVSVRTHLVLRLPITLSCVVHSVLCCCQAYKGDTEAASARVYQARLQAVQIKLRHRDATWNTRATAAVEAPCGVLQRSEAVWDDN